MGQLPDNIKEIFEFLNWFLIIAQMLALFGGLKKFREVPLVGSWFRWKAPGYTLIIFGIDMVILYYLWKGNPLFAAIRLTIARLVVLWETLYCFYYRFERLSPAVKFALTHPWVIDGTVKEIGEAQWRKAWRWLKKQVHH